MSDLPLDEALAQQLLKMGLVTQPQVRDALQLQAERALKGETVPLGEILVKQGLLTQAVKDNLEKKLGTQKEESRHLGPYRILRKLGEGGMGVVYLAEDTATGNKVALKVLPKIAAREEETVRRFLREVDSARKLDHPNIVRAGAAGEDKGLHYYVMEYVEGETLGARLKRTQFLPPDEATKVVLQVTHGLKHAHEQGFIHRDIKPDNMIVSREGVAKILDMGLSKNIDETQTFRTVTGMALGTPHYIAPEQARAEKGIDGRADIYSLGATYYHLVTGETPFHGSTAIEIISQHLNKQLPDPRDIRDGIPDGVVHILRRMMAKKPKDRYKDCGELLTDLELVVGGHNPSSQELDAAHSAVALPMAREARERFRAQRRGQRPGTYRATTGSKSSSTPLVLGVVAAVLVICIVGAIAVSGGDTKPADPTPVSVKMTRPEVPRPRDPDPRPGEPAPRVKTREELRTEEAQRKRNEIREAESRLADSEVRRRYADFAREYADTAEGKTVADWLKNTDSKPEELLKPEDPQPKVPKPPSPAPKEGTPEGKPELVQPQPVVKPPAPTEQLVKPPPPLVRPAVPDAAKLRDAEFVLKKAFPIDKAKTSKDKADLARTLLSTAVTSGARDAEYFVLLRQARDLATQGLDAKTALEAIDLRTAAFDVDAWGEKVELFAKTTAKGTDAAAWAGAALDVAEEASEGDDYEAAVKLATRAEVLARSANDRALQDTAKARINEFADLKRVADGLKPHFKKLETSPDDPAANAAAGKFVSLVKGDWKRGVPMMAKGSDVALKNLADQEQANPGSAAEQAALGEAWASQAEKETPTYKARARGRAAEWLGWAIPGLSGLAKVSAEKKLASLGVVAGPKTRGKALELASRPGSIDLLKLIDIKKDIVKGEWSFDGDNLKIRRTFQARIHIPYIPPEEYDLSIVAEKIDHDWLIIGLTSGQSRFAACLGAMWGWGSGLEHVDGKAAFNNETNYKPDVFKIGKPSKILISVRSNVVDITVDEIRIIHWTGGYKRLALAPGAYPTPNNECLFLGANESDFVIRKMVLVPISGKGKVVR
jgi:serine/threonine-protein kinase